MHGTPIVLKPYRGLPLKFFAVGRLGKEGGRRLGAGSVLGFRVHRLGSFASGPLPRPSKGSQLQQGILQKKGTKPGSMRPLCWFPGGAESAQLAEGTGNCLGIWSPD